MTLVDAEEELATDQQSGDRTIELPVEDRPSCPACEAEPALQATVARQPDGALEIVVLVCTKCAVDHPVWF